MTIKALHASTVVACGLLCLSNTIGNSAEDQPVSAKSPFPSEVELNKAVPTGLPKAELIKRYGEPFVSAPMENGAEKLVYETPGFQRHVPAKFRYSGFCVTLTNGKVANVTATHSSFTTYRPSPPDNKQSSGTNMPVASIAFSVVSDDPAPGAKYLDSKRLPKIGFVRDQPDLVIREIMAVDRVQEVFGPGTNDFREALSITLTDADAKRFAHLTETLLGERLLITVGTEPVSAPVVQSSIQTGRFTLAVKPAEDTVRIFEQIRGLVRK